MLDPHRPHTPTVAYLNVAVALTWPMPLHPVPTIVGLPQTTGVCHLWVLWWARHHADALNSSLLFYPNGGHVLRQYGSDVLSPLPEEGFADATAQPATGAPCTPRRARVC